GIAMQLRTQINSAEQLLQLGYPLDAARVYSEVLSDSEKFLAASRSGNNDLETKAQEGLSRALQRLSSEGQTHALRELFKPHADVKKTGSAIDLILLVQPHDLQRAALTSLLFRALKAAAKPGLPPEASPLLKALREQDPRDFSVQVTIAL